MLPISPSFGRIDMHAIYLRPFNVARLFGAFNYDIFGDFYLVMEYCIGESLAHHPLDVWRFIKSQLVLITSQLLNVLFFFAQIRNQVWECSSWRVYECKADRLGVFPICSRTSKGGTLNYAAPEVLAGRGMGKQSITILLQLQPTPSTLAIWSLVMQYSSKQFWTRLKARIPSSNWSELDRYFQILSTKSPNECWKAVYENSGKINNLLLSKKKHQTKKNTDISEPIKCYHCSVAAALRHSEKFASIDRIILSFRLALEKIVD